MNFFGHAVVATWTSREPLFVLGAMLPDFAAMCRTRISQVHDDRIRRGVELHHRTDLVFHELAWFRQHSRRLSANLCHLGVRRGPARGAGHVAIELILDDALARSARDGGAYADSLAVASTATAFWTFAESSADQRFNALVARLRASSPSPSPLIIAERVARALGRRPLLAMSRTETERVAAALPAATTELSSSIDSLLDELREALALDVE